MESCVDPRACLCAYEQCVCVCYMRACLCVCSCASYARAGGVSECLTEWRVCAKLSEKVRESD